MISFFVCLFFCFGSGIKRGMLIADYGNIRRGAKQQIDTRENNHIH